ncbi:hypothetical protein [Streptomyces sp. H27-S2]|uniref:hypothetical protein n=1 Tax=Streptomyces antarcticus TaxID=2996458 RepID=UPI00226EDAAE|nr:hypothetical protein [Streptomyces sp. H27-S2]MCY0954976.1 hypothetical protein [Streptomyces sp. H27-S2]
MSSPTDNLLFDVPASRTPAEQLLHLAAKYTRHNDALSLFRPTAASAPALDAHAASAARLTRAALAAVQTVHDQQPYLNPALVDATVRIKQLAYLSGEAGRHLNEAQEAVTGAALADPDLTSLPDSVNLQVQLARELTALAPEAAIASATGIARETQRRHPTVQTATAGLATAELAALHATALGQVVVTQSQAREYVHSRNVVVRISTLRSLEAKHLITRDPATAPPAFDSGPPQDRIRLTSDGVTATIGVLTLPPATAAPTALAVPHAPTASGPFRAR